MAAAPSAAEIKTSTDTGTGSARNSRKDTGTGVGFWTAKIAMTIENASARKTISCDTSSPFAAQTGHEKKTLAYQSPSRPAQTAWAVARRRDPAAVLASAARAAVADRECRTRCGRSPDVVRVAQLCDCTLRSGPLWSLRSLKSEVRSQKSDRCTGCPSRAVDAC